MLDESPAAAIDDCWNRIGVFGDQRCERLPEHIHCRNCERYASAAIRLLDRHTLARERTTVLAAPPDEAPDECVTLVIFRVGDEWLALAGAQLIEIAATVPIHSLPHQQTPALLGISNVRGALVAALALAPLLGLDAGASTDRGEQRRPLARMLVLDGDGGPLLVPVDEVDGIHRVPCHQIGASRHDGAQALGRFARGVLRWREHSVTLLHEALLLQTLARSLR